MKKTVMCLVQSYANAEAIVRRLQTSGYANKDISVLFPTLEAAQEFASKMHTKAPDGALLGAEAGGAIGVTLGFFVGLGALAIPGIGPFLAVGPILAALGGGAAGAIGGGVAGALVGFGIPEEEAKRYESGIKTGQLLVSVHTETSADQRRIETLFRTSGAIDVYATTDLEPNAPTVVRTAT